MDSTNKSVDLCRYRINSAEETLDTAKLCIENKRHKDAIAYFNQNYVATDIFDREVGKKLGRLKRKRETNDYDDFYIASYDDALEQYEAANLIIASIKKFLEVSLLES
jgi:uncharacterized protein (UPF0332 family)